TTWILWNWTNPSDPDFNHTEVWIDSEFKENVTTPDHSYNATGLIPNTNHEIGTKTVDVSGNVNQTWVNDTAKTLIALTCGDVNGDGNVNWFDYVTLRAYVLGAPGWTVESNWAADVNGDGSVNWFDYITLRACVLGAPGWELNCS
ncbi:dockerin type I repeat-containing protein, partial [bacterium]|nr:dockerin type I repeat-containing protein [bacterium]